MFVPSTLLWLGLLWIASAALPRVRHRTMILELLCATTIGALLLSLRLFAPAPVVTDAAVEATLLDVSSALDDCRLEVWIHGAQAGRARVRAPQDACGYSPGERVLAAFQLEAPRRQRNPGGYDARRSLARHGVHRVGSVVAGRIARIETPVPTLRTRWARVRGRVGDAADPGLFPSGPILRALVTGDRSRLSPKQSNLFVASGTAHLLAVSGLHVSWVLLLARWMLLFPLRALPFLVVQRRASAISWAFGWGVATGYAGLAGLSLPTLRAWLMGGIFVLAILRGRPGMTWNALALAVMVILCAEPAELFGGSFWLSVSAVAGIAFWRPPPVAWRATFACTIAAGLATAPTLAHLGWPVPRAGWLANLVMVPLFGTLVVPAAFGTTLLTWLWPDAALPVQSWLDQALSWMMAMLHGLASRDVSLGLGYPRLVLFAAAMVGFYLRASYLRAGHRAVMQRSALLALPLVLSVMSPLPWVEDPTFTFFDVGHGDAVLVRHHESAWLIDAGPSYGRFDAGRAVVLPGLRAVGVTRLDRLVVTHADMDHRGGAVAVLNQIPVEELWLSGAEQQTPSQQELARLANARGARVRWMTAGLSDTLGDVSVSMLWPVANFSSQTSNRRSIVLRFEHPHGCVLLPGDIPAETEARLAASSPSCEVLKLAHHGSATSTVMSWLRALQPEIAIASASNTPTRRLPAAVVRARLDEEQVKLYETADSGRLELRLEAGGIRVDTFIDDPSLHSSDDEKTGTDRP